MVDKKKITKEMLIGEILTIDDANADILMNADMGCVHCPCAQGETLEQGCSAHGMSDEAVQKLVDKLNE